MAGPHQLSIHPWSVPVYWVSASTPLVDVHAAQQRGARTSRCAGPCPWAHRAAPEADGHLTLVDVTAGRAYDFYQGRPRADGGWDCTLCSTVDLRGSGVRPPKGGPTEWYASHGSRACGFPLMAARITAAELRAGGIRRALVLATPGFVSAGSCRPPAPGAPANSIISERGRALRRSPAAGPAGRGHAGSLAGGAAPSRARSECAAFVGDFSGSINVYADGSPDAREAFAGVLESGSTAGLDVSHLRVIEWGSLTPDG
ncbi:MAG: hypothetical protein IPG17_32835 [Sandaracinaceae bacterium]|nr:hypothetical protein [Sandaracinaceae bacterium]